MRRVITGNDSSAAITISRIILFLACAISVPAQNTRNTDYSPDQTLKSNARINPSTLAMELSIPLGGYKGRAGNATPINFDYTSKVWQMRTTVTRPLPGGHTLTEIQALYSKRMAAGWTSSLGVARIDFHFEIYRGNDLQEGMYEGQIADPLASTGDITFNLYTIKRVQVSMPDGSSHEFRAGDLPIQCGATNGQGCPNRDFTGTYLSVDGSRMRLDVGSNLSILYLPDGSRMFFGARRTEPTSGDEESLATAYIDASGNKTIYDTTNKRWIDTLGRIFDNPLPTNAGFIQEQTVHDQPFGLPGFGGGLINTALSWRYLQDSLENPNQALGYISDKFCTTTSSDNITGTHLFRQSQDAYIRVCNYGASNPGPVFNPVVLTKITLANGQIYQFRYNIYGEITKIIYPTGAYERFVYGTVPAVQESKDAYDQANRGVVDRYLSPSGIGNDEIHWHYAATRGTPSAPAPYKVTTANPDGTFTEQFIYDEPKRDDYVFGNPKPYGFDGGMTGRSYENRVYSSTYQLLRRHLTAYIATAAASGVNPQTGGIKAWRDLRPAKEINLTFEPGNSYALVQMSETVYDTSGNSDPAYFSALNAKQRKTYHYAAVSTTTAASAGIETLAALFSDSNLAVVTETDYLYDANYKARNISGLATETRVKDASENIKAKTQINYDESVYSVTSDGAMPGAAANSWVNLTSPGELGELLGGKRGLPTSVKNYYDIESGGYIETHTFYDQYGNVRISRDGRGSDTETQYDDNYAFAYPTSVTTPIPDPSGRNGSSTAFTSLTTYDYITGLPLIVRDANNQETKMSYRDPVTGELDPLLRVRKITAPNGQQTITEYGTPDSNGQFPASQRFISVKTQIDDDKWKQVYSWLDGLGRTTGTQTIDSSGDIFSEIEYDQMGRIKRSTNPHRAGETKYWTESFYDDLSRVTKIKTLGDNAEILKSYSLATSGNQIGAVVTVTDQSGKLKRSVTDALGQLSRVDEPDGSGNLGNVESPVQATIYAYNTLGKIIEVVQGVQKRHFLYDSLGRLLRVQQPEQQANYALNLSGSETTNAQWTAAFTYDNNGNVLTATDAKNITITSSYDSLNRIVSKSYSDSVTPSTTFFYDSSNVPNSKGNLTKVISSVSETYYTVYDEAGRLLSSVQKTDGLSFSSSCKYNLAGAMTEQTYPSGRVVKNFLADNGNLSAISSKVPNGQFKTYASNFSYTANGEIKHLQIGNGLWESAKLNSRQQVTELNLGTSSADGSKWKLTYDYGEIDANGNIDATKNSGNIARQTINFSDLSEPFIQTYKYDSLDRIIEAKEMNGSNQTWKQTWMYDRYGNRAGFTQNIGGQQLQINNLTLPQIDPNTNRYQSGQGYEYDSNGNLIQDATGWRFTFDAENNQTEVRDSANNLAGRYYYDGNRKRVKKVTSSETTIFVYDGSGKLAAEYSTAVPAANPTVKYTATDSLGSPRVITNKQGEIISRRDFMPFGEQLVPDVNYRTANLKYSDGDNVRQKFTGYQRDEESGLDFAEARYYNDKHGRFTAVDPLLASGKSANPQTFNRYVYTMNRPLILTDPTGLQVGKKSETPQSQIPLPKSLLDLASLDSMSTTNGMVYKLTKDEVKQRVELATLAYNEGFKQGEKQAQALLGENIEINSVESVDTSSKEKSRENSIEGGLSITSKDTGGSVKLTDKVGQKEENGGSFKVQATVNSGVSEAVAGAKSVAETRQRVINTQGAVVRDAIDQNNKSVKVIVDVTNGIDNLIKNSRLIGKSDGFTGYIKSHPCN